MQIIVFPFLARFLMLSVIELAMYESKPDVGSSQNRIDGFVIISEAKASLRFSPPDIPFAPKTPIKVSWHFLRFNLNFFI